MITLDGVSTLFPLPAPPFRPASRPLAARVVLLNPPQHGTIRGSRRFRPDLPNLPDSRHDASQKAKTTLFGFCSDKDQRSTWNEERRRNLAADIRGIMKEYCDFLVSKTETRDKRQETRDKDKGTDCVSDKRTLTSPTSQERRST